VPKLKKAIHNQVLSLSKLKCNRIALGECAKLMGCKTLFFYCCN